MATGSRMALQDERPSTSSGPGSGKPLERANTSKRISRDDLALNTRFMAADNVKLYHIPIRGRLPTPDASPTKQSLSREIPVRVSTPDSVDDVTETGLIAIGMALGSPTQAPASGVTPWQIHEPARSWVAAPEVQEPPPGMSSGTKSRRWALFGRSKSKRSKNPEMRQQRSMTDGAVYSPPSSITDAQDRGDVAQPRQPKPRKTPKHKPIIVRSQTEPVVSHRVDDRQRSAPTRIAPEPPRKVERSQSQDNLERQRTPSVSSSSASHSVASNSGRLLDVNIPSIEMERYSIMFGEVLRPQSASSLLARRQAALNRLKTIGDAENRREELARPQLPKTPYSHQGRSPSFSLFPSPPVKPDVSRLTPRLRSNTSPALLPSPVQESFFENEHNPKATREQATGPSWQGSTLKKTAGSPQMGRMPTQGSPSMRGKESQAMNIAKATDHQHQVHLRERVRPKLNEPKWEKVSAPSPAISQNPTIAKKTSTPRNPDSMNSPQSASGSNDKPLPDAVQISIARQISMSRQQRRLLLPLHDATPRRKRDPNSGSVESVGPAVMITVGKDERIAETKISTPTVIHPEPEAAMTSRSMHKYHKSEQVIVESA